jgi:TnpA family transposase
VFAQTLIPGTQRDSLITLDGLLANQTLIQPSMVSTDTADASEIVFALAWALGYRWAPRLADLPDQRLWRINPGAHYGKLKGPARHRINPRLIADNWDEICRLTASYASAPSRPRRSCGRCNAAPTPPAWPEG